MTDQPWRLLSSGTCAPDENMAIDEALLEHGRDLRVPLLRFYGWSMPAASFGFFQRFNDVAGMTQLRPLVRRPTGGGLVPHDRDWTYSLIFPPNHEWYALKAIASYHTVHAWVQQSFRTMGIQSDLAPERQGSSVGQCFIGAEQFDLVAAGQKIAGAAQRRNKFGLLIQGSVQPPAGARRDEWETAMCIGRAWTPFVPPQGWTERVRELVRGKYSRDEYNRRR